MGEVVYGIDFRAGKEEAPLCNAPDDFGPASTGRLGGGSSTATTLCQRDLPAYVAPSDDCA